MRDRLSLVLWVVVWGAGGASTQQLCGGSGDGDDQAAAAAAAQPFPSYRPPLLAPRVETRADDGLRPLYYFARSFLRAVQPNSIPAGVILAFTANSRVRLHMGPSLQQLTSNVATIEKNLASIPQGMEHVLEQYSIPKAEISQSIQEMDVTVSGTTMAHFKSAFQNALADLSTVVEDASGTSESLHSMEEIRGSLQSRQKTLRTDLTMLRTNIQLLGACPICELPDISNLETDADYNLILSVKGKLESMPSSTVFRFLVEQAVSELSTSVRQAAGPLDRYDHAR
ncbi:hypothetical protein CRUP_009224 [Coryphaenoides rupestris]|nr:hypothetical protein CRUP_009224 [Coryphaenoides rupestris]